MIEALLGIFFNFLLGILNFFPNAAGLGYDNYSWVGTLLDCLAYLNSFIGLDIFLVAVGHSVLFWLAEIGWSIVEWIIKKIPGVD